MGSLIRTGVATCISLYFSESNVINSECFALCEESLSAASGLGFLRFCVWGSLNFNDLKVKWHKGCSLLIAPSHMSRMDCLLGAESQSTSSISLARSDPCRARDPLWVSSEIERNIKATVLAQSSLHPTS